MTLLFGDAVPVGLQCLRKSLPCLFSSYYSPEEMPLFCAAKENEHPHALLDVFKNWLRVEIRNELAGEWRACSQTVISSKDAGISCGKW